MKILKRILLAIILIIVLALVIALFVKKDYAVEREVTINKPRQEVFDFIKYCRNQEQFNKWWMMDPEKKVTATGTDGTVGYIIAWDSKNGAGKGEEEIKKITDGESVDHEIRFEKPFEGIAEVHLSTEATGNNQTKVNWTFKGRNKYPMNLTNLFIDGMLGKDMQKSLENLKTLLEK